MRWTSDVERVEQNSQKVSLQISGQGTTESGQVDDKLIAAHTKLGWVIFGSNIEDNGSVFHVHECDCVMLEKKMDELIKKIIRSSRLECQKQLR